MILKKERYSMEALHSSLLSISQLSGPSDLVLAPDRIIAVENVRETAKAWGVYRSDAHFDEAVSMSLYLYPYAPAKRLEVVMLFNTIGFFFDDGMGHDRHQGAIQVDKTFFVAKLSKALRDPQQVLIETSDIVTARLLEVAGNVLKLVYDQSNLEFTQRFRDGTLNHWKTSFGISDYYPSVEDFILIRRQTSGMYPMINMLEFAYDRYLPVHLYTLPSVQGALETLVDIGGLSNEIFSYPKEVMEQGAKMNFISVIQQSYQCDLMTAIYEAIEYVNQRSREFNAYCDAIALDAQSLPQEEAELLLWYVEALQDIAWASYAWQMYTERYNHPQHIFSDKRADRIFKERIVA